MTVSPRQPPFVGRQRERTLLEARLGAALAGDGGAVLVEGEAGIGKTRLVAEVAREAKARGALVCWGRADEGAGAAVLSSWVQVLRAALAAGPDAPLSEGERAALAEVLPELGDRPQGAPADPEAARFRLFDAVATFLGKLAARRPLLLVLDDIQWADPSSLGLLHQLTVGLQGERILLLATRRTGEGTAPEGTHALPHADRLTLGGLAAADVTRLVAAGAGREPAGALSATLSRETGGNPFAITEIVRLLAADGRLDEAHAEETWRLAIPESVRELVRRRLEPVSPACRDALAAIAVLGGEVRLPALERVSGLAAAALADALDEAVLARLVEAAPAGIGRYRIAHDLIREVIEADLPPGRRARMHAQAGEVVEGLSGAHIEARLAALAHHFLQAAPLSGPAKAIAYARRAGEQARTVAAYEDAARFYRMALEALDLAEPVDEGDRFDLLFALGEVQDRAGAVEAARECLRRAAALAARQQWPDRLARAALAFGGNALRVDRPDQERIVLLEQALALLDAGETALRARVLARLALSLVFTGERARAEVLSVEAEALARRSGEPWPLGQALFARHYLRWGPGDRDERLALADEIVALAEAVGDTELALHGERWRLADLLARGDIVGMDAAITRFRARAEQSHQPYFLWYAALFRAMRALLSGAHAVAEPAMTEALALGQAANNPEALSYYGYQVLLLRHQQGRRGELLEPVRAFAAMYPTLPSVRAALAFCLAAAEQFDAARAELETAAEALLRAPADSNTLSGFTVLAETCIELEYRPLARRLFDALAPYRGEIAVVASAVVCVGAVSHSLGRLALVLGRRAEARELLEEALAQHAHLGAAPTLADTQVALAGVLLRSEAAAERERGLDLLVQAVATTRSLGLSGAEAKVQAMLQAARTAAGLSADAELDALRARLADAEERAARDALTGLANRAAWDARLAALAPALRTGTARSALVLLDLDHFKRLNDTYGHLAGDQALRAAAGVIDAALGDGVFLARFGGEEFAALIEEDRPAALEERLERVRIAFHDANMVLPTDDWYPLTISIGAAIAASGDSPESLLERADRALYAAKRAGRDSVRVAA